MKAIFVRIRSDGSTGEVYVQEQTPVDLGGGPASLHVFAPDGRYLDHLAFDRPWRDFRVRDGRIFALTEDPGTGLAELVAYDIDAPGIPRSSG